MGCTIGLDFGDALLFHVVIGIALCFVDSRLGAGCEFVKPYEVGMGDTVMQYSMCAYDVAQCALKSIGGRP